MGKGRRKKPNRIDSEVEGKTLPWPSQLGAAST